MPAPSRPSRTATLQVVGTTVAATLLVVLVVVELVTVGGSRAAPAAGPPVAADQQGTIAAQPAPDAGALPTLPAPARAALDSANDAYRAGRFADALAGYRAAAAAAPGDVAPYFGIYMAATALHKGAAADSAIAVIRAHDGAAGGPTLSDSALRALHAGAGRATR